MNVNEVLERFKMADTITPTLSGMISDPQN